MNEWQSRENLASSSGGTGWMCRLPDTSMTSIAMGFFAANMERKLRLLFAPLNEWSLDYDFDLGEFILFPVVDEIAVIQ